MNIKYTNCGQKETYRIWTNMINRCKDHLNNPSYGDCSICSEWLNFDNFASWFNSYPYKQDGWHLDKDILCDGEKCYSPETCTFIPMELNLLLTSRKGKRGKYPVGVSYDKSVKLFKAKISKRGKTCTIGNFRTPEEAFIAYKTEKESWIRQMCSEYSHVLDPRIVEVLSEWEVCVDD